MDPGEWLAAFKVTHEQAKKGSLNEEQYKKYLAMREELARSLVAAQGLTVPEGQNARKYFRVAQLYTLEVSNLYKSVTRDISRSGFSSVMTANFSENQKVTFAITLGRGTEPVTGQAHVVAAVKQGGNTRVSFAIDSMPNADVERLELALFDAFLSRVK